MSTLHCNDTYDAVQRLDDLDVSPNSMASELIGVLVQRLAKRNCSNCCTEVDPDPELVAEIFPDGPPDDFQTYRGEGCRQCDGHGVHGRIGVVEFLEVRTEMRQAISEGKTGEQLRTIGEEMGVDSLRDNGLRLVRQGLVPLEELPRVLSPEQLAG